MFGLRRHEHAVQADREVERAAALVAELYGLSVDEASKAAVGIGAVPFR